MGHCLLCHTDVPDEDLGIHMLQKHEIDMTNSVETWPDGSPVIIDTTLEPEDFE